jgi:hypothetical protein
MKLFDEAVPDVEIIYRPIMLAMITYVWYIKKTPRPESPCELYRPSNRRFSAKTVPTFVDKGCHVISVTDPYGRILAFLDRSRYFFFQVAPQLYS